MEKKREQNLKKTPGKEKGPGVTKVSSKITTASGVEHILVTNIGGRGQVSDLLKQLVTALQSSQGVDTRGRGSVTSHGEEQNMMNNNCDNQQHQQGHQTGHQQQYQG